MSDTAQLDEPVTDAMPRDGGDEPASRRAFFLRALAGAAAAAAAPGVVGAQGRRTPRPKGAQLANEMFESNMASATIAAPAEWANVTARLVRRATMGINDATLSAAKAQGYQNWLQSQLDYQRIDATAVENQTLALWPLVGQGVDTLFNQNQGTVQSQLQAAWTYRAVLSPRQLYERMVEFWSDHFNIEIAKVGYLKVVDDRDVIRKHALGKFSDIVKASAKSPAMLAYLDQTVSRVGAPNQNYARELLELHTLGVDGGYSQDDVAELARVLTGWTIQGRGNFTFNPVLHDWGAKTVMGVTIPAGSPSLGAAGIAEGEQIIDMLVKHPNTAKFISTKLLKWFLTPDPTPAQVSAISSVFRVTGGDMKLVVRAILNSGWVAAAPAKFKRPFHYVISALRAANATVTNTIGLNAQLVTLGQPLYLWETPDGYPDLFEYWSGNLMPRWQFGTTLSNFRTGNIVINSAPYLAGTPDAAIDMLNVNLFGGEMDAAARSVLLTYLKSGNFNDQLFRETLSLAVASRSFQWY